MLDSLFTNGVIAVREKNLFGGRLSRLAEGSAADAARAVTESGFGSGAESSDAESLCRAEEAALDAFIREYAPTAAIKAYFLAPHDFHNAKALVKAAALGSDPADMLAPEGLTAISEISAAVSGRATDGLPEYLAEPLNEAFAAGEGATGAEIGAIFDRAEYKYIRSVCRRNPALKRLAEERADRTNILVAMRCRSLAEAEKYFVGGGKTGFDKFADVFADGEKAAKAFDGTPYAEFYALCLAAKEKGEPFTGAERALESAEVGYFSKIRYDLEGKQPFIYYVFRKKAEIADVRILLTCLNAGLPAAEIKKRLRSA